MTWKRTLSAIALSIALCISWAIIFPNSALGSYAQRIGGTVVAISSLANGEVLLFNGTNWINSTVGTSSTKPGNTKVTSASVLTINDGCNASDPCNVRVGNTTYSLTTSATATITAGGGSGTGKVFISSAGVVTAQTPTAAGLTVTCTNCTHAQVTSPAFPANSVPLYDVTITSGAWASVTDLRSFIGGGVGVGGMVLLESHTETAAASVEFNNCISTSYDSYRFELIDIVLATASRKLAMQLSVDSGANWLGDGGAGSNLYNTNTFRWSGGSVGGGNSTIDNWLLPAFDFVTNDANYPIRGSLILIGPLKGGRVDLQGTIHFYRVTDLVPHTEIQGQWYNDNVAVNAVRFYSTASETLDGNLSGTINCYGLAKQ